MNSGTRVWLLGALILGVVVVIHCLGIAMVTIGTARLLSTWAGSGGLGLPAIVAGAVVAGVAAWLSLALVGIAGLALLLRLQRRSG